MRTKKNATVAVTGEPDWYKDAVIYELHVRSFFDSDGDGIGDFRGLTEKLDYLEELGITTIWLLPFSPSPWRDDGYDIADYRKVHPAYGTLQDFKNFIKEAHRRGLRVLTELVINHTSDQHPWFQRARRARPGSKWRDFYVWTDNPNRYSEARIIFQDFESSNWSWDPVAQAYFWHRFYAHQPDLNYDNPQVRHEVLQLLDYWLKMGIDGLRLDAVPYLFEREGTNCENLPETHAFLKELRSHVDRNFKNRLLLAEANQWPEDAASYFGAGDECHMAFHFPIMPRLFIALRMEDRFPVVEALLQTPEIPASCQWAIFLRNHDELTLEMVTDEERDYMYRVYARQRKARINLGIRRRLAPLMGNSRPMIELMMSLLFALPGTPVIYYGDEIGMGDNIYLGDRNGVRTPMQWSPDRNAGFSRADPQSLHLPPIIDQEYHYEFVNVEIQQNNPGSLLWRTRRLIALRRTYKAFGRGTIELLHPENRKILAFIRRYNQESILVVANFSRLIQCVELNLSAYRGMVPVTLYGRVEFPVIGDAPYFLSMGPYSFAWFSLQSPTEDEMLAQTTKKEELPVLETVGHWSAVLEKEARPKLKKVLQRFVSSQRWFRGKARLIRSVRISETVWCGRSRSGTCLAMIEVEYTEGDPETYLVPLAFATQVRAEASSKTIAPAAICRVLVKEPDQTGILYDATVDPDFGAKLLDLIEKQRALKGTAGGLTGRHTKALHALLDKAEESPAVSIMSAEQINTSVRFGDRFILKLFRRLEEGTNSEVEIGRFLTKKGFPFIAPFAGELEYQPHARTGKEPTTVAILHGWVRNQGDAWEYTMDVLSRYLEEMVARHPNPDDLAIPEGRLIDRALGEMPAICYDLIGSYLESARLLGERTADMHLALASEPDDQSFTSEKFTVLYQRSLYQSMLQLTGQAFRVLKQRLKSLPEDLQGECGALLAQQTDLQTRFKSLLGKKINAVRIRCHGDYHLGQVLFTGNDFVIMDFEGEPARPMSERRIKRSPLHDVAGMLRSFHYAAYSALFAQRDAGLVRSDDLGYTETLALFWHQWVSVSFLKAYLETIARVPLVPESRDNLQMLLDVYTLEKSVYELGYELNNRPDWVHIPIQGIRHILGG